jgi:sialate O-acetylesterase
MLLNGSRVRRLGVLPPWLTGLAAVMLASPAYGNVAVKPPFASSMVLQRDMEVPIWGTAAGGEQVSVAIASQTKTVTTPANGKWSLKLDPMPAGGPYVVTIKGTNTVTLDDVYVGEVWQAAGQSNMDTRLNFYNTLSGEISQANHPLLRYYTLRQPGQTTTWEVVSPSTAGPLSALAYFFGKEIQEQTGVAVGLVVTAVGGTKISSWLDPATLSAHAEVKDSDRGSMWNSWVAPVVGYGLRGTIWFQGEQNTNGTDAPSYGERFNWLIDGWRAAWGQGDFPFFFGQLSNIHDAQTDPNNSSDVATVREGQRMALALPGTAMSVNMDIGIANDWHFPNKPEAGHRLALPARAKVYGETNLVYSGPFYVSKSIAGNEVTLNFEHVGGGLVVKDAGPLKGFAIAGASGTWVWGNATISGNTVVVSSPTVPSPTRVRYAWGDNPVFSLYNKEGLPAMPFTTESPELVPPVTGGMAGSGGTAGSDGGTAGAAGSGGMGGVASGEGGKVGGEGGSAGGIANNVAGAGLVGAGTAGATSGVGGLTGAPAAAGSDDAGCACTTVQPRSRSTRALSLVLLALVTGLSRRSRGSSAPRSNASGDRSPSRGHGSDTL